MSITLTADCPGSHAHARCLFGLFVLIFAVGCQGVPTAHQATVHRGNDSSTISGTPSAAESINADSFGDATNIVDAESSESAAESSSLLFEEKAEFAAGDKPSDEQLFPSGAWLKTGIVSDWWEVESRYQEDWLEDRLWPTLWSDQRNFYVRSNLPSFLGGVAAGAVLANSSLDIDTADWYQSKVRNEFTDDLSSIAKPFGEQWQMLSLYVAASILGRAGYAGPRAQEWGDRSFRSMIVGVPPLLLMQKVFGSSRPGESDSSGWDFWADSNGVSGHAFVGAVPFLIAAQLSDYSGARVFWTVVSTLPAWSRVNDNDHYLSQAILGWWLAEMVTRGMVPAGAPRAMNVAPWTDGRNVGVGLEFRR